MTTNNTKQKEGLTKLIAEYKKLDHWVGLDSIVEMANLAADNVDTIAHQFEKIKENREQLPEHLVRLMAFIEIAKVKLSIMPSEWNEAVDETIEQLLKEVPKPNFDDMEF